MAGPSFHQLRDDAGHVYRVEYRREADGAHTFRAVRPDGSAVAVQDYERAGRRLSAREVRAGSHAAAQVAARPQAGGVA